MGIQREIIVFLTAVLSGGIVRLMYRCLSCFREIVHHTHWVIELEDLFYWIGTAVFLFVQIYHISNGEIRWYIILELAAGVTAMSVIIVHMEKIYRK